MSLPHVTPHVCLTWDVEAQACRCTFEIRSFDLANISADPDFVECIEACDRILGVKGNDYTQGDAVAATDDKIRLKNFYRNGERLGLPPMKILAVYLNKHLDAIETYLKRGQVESEPIEGRIHDAINYLLLLYKMVQVEKRARQDHP